MERIGEFQHSIPQFHLKGFVSKQGIWIINKNKGTINSRETPVKKPGYEVNFGKKDFYGQDSINNITDEKTIVNDKTKRVEDFLGIIETKVGLIFKKTRDTNKLILNEEETKWLRLNYYIQHVRTPKFRRDVEDFKKTQNFKLLKKEIRNFFDNFSFYNLMQLLEKRFSTSNHSALIVLKEMYEYFNEIVQINNKNIFLIINDSNKSLILPDSGMVWAPLKTSNETICYMPISPKLCFFLSEQKCNKNIIHIDKKEVDDINELSWLESDKEIYSNDKKTLEELYEEFKDKKIITRDGTKTFE